MNFSRINIEDIWHDYAEILDVRSDFSEKHAYAAYRIASALSDYTSHLEEFPTPLLFREIGGELAVENWMDYDSCMQNTIKTILTVTNAHYVDDMC
jgi:hypothetical protein